MAFSAPPPGALRPGGDDVVYRLGRQASWVNQRAWPVGRAMPGGAATTGSFGFGRSGYQISKIAAIITGHGTVQTPFLGAAGMKRDTAAMIIVIAFSVSVSAAFLGTVCLLAAFPCDRSKELAPEVAAQVNYLRVPEDSPAEKAEAADRLGVLAYVGADAHAAVPHLIDMLRDTTPLVQEFHDGDTGVLPGRHETCPAAEAATALGEIGDRQAVEPLIAALESENQALRDAAAEALGNLGDHRAGKALAVAARGEGRHQLGYAKVALARIREKGISKKEERQSVKVRQAAGGGSLILLGLAGTIWGFLSIRRAKRLGASVS